jgi:deoxycytidine triphosphate deaminase
MSLGKTIEKTRREKEHDRLLELVARRPKDDSEYPFTGVLLNDAIERCATSFGLISPFSGEHLKPANYKLRIGDEYAIKGQIKQLSDQPGQNEITIQPFDVAVIKTLETLNMPRFLIARWNIRVQLAYEGLLWVGGPQVDAGYVGHLFCPIYNLSDKPVTLKYGDYIAVIDFIKTSSFNEGSSMDYPGLPERLLFEDYNPEKLKSALPTRLVSELTAFKDRLEQLTGDVDKRITAMQGRMDNFISITFGVVALLFAAVTLFFGKPNEPNWWDPNVFWICTLAILISMFAWVNSKSSVQWFRQRWQRIAFELLMVGIALVTIASFSKRTQSQVRELEIKVQTMQQNLDRLTPKGPAAQPFTGKP